MVLSLLRQAQMQMLLSSSSDSDEELLMIITILAMQKRSKRQRESSSRRRRFIQRRLEFNSSNRFNTDQIQCSNQDSEIKGKIPRAHSVKHFRYIFLHPKSTWKSKIFWTKNSLLVSPISLPLRSLAAALTKSSCSFFSRPFYTILCLLISQEFSSSVAVVFREGCARESL